MKNLTLKALREKPWIVVKFCILFTAVAGFVSYNFGGLKIGLPAALLITVLSIAYWKIFDAASDVFFDINQADDAGAKTKKVTGTMSKRIFYSSLDYVLAASSFGLVIALKELGFSYLTAVCGIWLVIDIPSSVIFVAIYEKTGRDMTLGRSYRRMANVILSHSKIAGSIVFIYEITLASFWSGPDYTVLFFKDELKTRVRLAVAVLSITAVHAVLWTAVYWLGHDNILELIKHLKG
ncbi:MAG: hypothetical protein ACOYU2_04190 [Nitrospirota bacterium]